MEPKLLYNKANLLPGKIADNYLVFTETKTYGKNSRCLVEVNAPEISVPDDGEHDDLEYPVEVAHDSVKPTETFLVDAKPIVKEMVLYSDHENPWTNNTFVVTKFQKIQEEGQQMDIEGNVEDHHLVAFTSTDGRVLNTKEMSTLPVPFDYDRIRDGSAPFEEIENLEPIGLYPADMKNLMNIFNEFIKEAPGGDNRIEMRIGDGKLYLSAQNSKTNQTMRAVICTINIDS